MNALELAAKLHERQYRHEMSKAEELSAKEYGLVVVFGASDDLMEFRGAINDELGCYGGGEAHVDGEGLLPERDNIDDDEELKKFFSRQPNAKQINAEWDKNGYSWVISTQIPHYAFDILDGDEPYCQGIVFALADVEKAGA